MMEVRNCLSFFFLTTLNQSGMKWEVQPGGRPLISTHSHWWRSTVMVQYSEGAIQVTSSGQFLMRQVETEKSFLITFGFWDQSKRSQITPSADHNALNHYIHILINFIGLLTILTIMTYASQYIITWLPSSCLKYRDKYRDRHHVGRIMLLRTMSRRIVRY